MVKAETMFTPRRTHGVDFSYRIGFSLLTDSVSVETSTQTSGSEALNKTDTELSQNKSGNTEEVLNSSITTIKQPAQDLVNNINNFPRKNKEGAPAEKRN